MVAATGWVFSKKTEPSLADRAQQHVQGSGQHHRADGPAKDDHGGGDLLDVADLSSVNDQAAQNSTDTPEGDRPMSRNRAVN